LTDQRLTVESGVTSNSQLVKACLRQNLLSATCRINSDGSDKMPPLAGCGGVYSYWEIGGKQRTVQSLLFMPERNFPQVEIDLERAVAKLKKAQDPEVRKERLLEMRSLPGRLTT